jgi:hypothetical protein
VSGSIEQDSLERYTHIGWIPCISGHIDFGLMSVGLVGNHIEKKTDRKPVTINYAKSGMRDGHCRRIVMQSRVDWRDRLVGDGEFRVIVVAEATESPNLDARSLNGTILMFPKAYSKELVEHHHRILAPVDALKKRYSSFLQSTPNQNQNAEGWGDCQRALNATWEDLRKVVTSGEPFGPDGKEVYAVDFFIDHLGFTFLRYRENDLDIEQPLPEYDRYIIVRQAFYYLKYSLHRHKHHAEESDALTTVVPYRTDDKKTVALQIIGQLKRELVRIKRTQRQNHRRQDDSEAVGILGYMRSLLASCLWSSFLDEELYNRESDWLKGMELSFGAQHDRIRSQNQRRDSVNQAARQWTAFALAFFTATCLIWLNVAGRPNGGSDSGSAAIFDLVVSYYWAAAIFVFVFMWAVGWTIRFSMLLDLDRPRLLRKIKMASWWQIVFLLAGVLLLTGPGLYALYERIYPLWQG